tara:strand:- start:207 stop:1544 length:1338 start_codon:yes stop_codon:yes gene_type:complete
MIRQNLSRTLLCATAIAALSLTGCSGVLGGSKTASASDAATARAKGDNGKAIALAEQAALAAPADATAKAELGNSYLAAGRFVSAQHAFDDALVLGDVSPRTALGFVLASIAVGDNRAAIETLNDWRDAMSASDAGLAYALAGNPEMGAQVLSNALRAGDNTPTVRQNLAYAYALGGEWATARIIAAEDVAPDQLDKRISQWASVARPEDHAARVAALLGVDVQPDNGMPAQLALGVNTASDPVLAAADLPTEAAPRSGELPPVDLLAASTATRELKPIEQTSAPALTDFGTAFGGETTTVASRVISRPVVQNTPPKAPAPTVAVAEPKPRPKPKPAAPAREKSTDLDGGSHLVQLASYGSEAEAKRGWDIFTKRFPQIANREQVITRAKVKGRIYYRLSAGNLAASSARAVCSAVKAKGQGCIAWEESRPLPGTLDSGRRVASR